ncbi:hypothetical protein [Sphingobacterium sp. BS-2]|uniref:hypothetical protein n=1 Tax=Sphingobacterium sp. BS-2 TaxID=3377129 RepID=UPI0038FC6E4C
MRAYAISPYGIGVKYSLEYNCQILVYPRIPYPEPYPSGAEGASKGILVHFLILVYPPIPSILVQIPDGRRTPNILPPTLLQNLSQNLIFVQRNPHD